MSMARWSAAPASSPRTSGGSPRRHADIRGARPGAGLRRQPWERRSAAAGAAMLALVVVVAVLAAIVVPILVAQPVRRRLAGAAGGVVRLARTVAVVRAGGARAGVRRVIARRL